MHFVEVLVLSTAASHKVPADGEFARLLKPSDSAWLLSSHWPWGGDRFELRDIRALGRIAERCAGSLVRLRADKAFQLRVNQALAWLIEEGAAESENLIALLADLEADGPTGTRHRYGGRRFGSRDPRGTDYASSPARQDGCTSTISDDALFIDLGSHCDGPEPISCTRSLPPSSVIDKIKRRDN
jgi:hypothetical protein